MKHIFLAAIAMCMIFFVQTSYAQDRPFGFGVMVGEPTGFSAKLWTSNSNAFDFGLGWSIIGKGNDSGSGINIHADYLWHAWNAVNSTEQLPLYYGIGGRFRGGGNEGSFAVRGVLGIAWMPRQTTIDIFLEAAPSIELTPSTGLAVDAAVGVRYYF